MLTTFDLGAASAAFFGFSARVAGGALPARICGDFIRKATAEPTMNGVRATKIDGQGAPQSCNITACSRSYRYFRPSIALVSPVPARPTALRK